MSDRLREIAEAATPGEWAHGCLPGIDPRDNRIYAKDVPDEEHGHPWTTIFDGQAAFDDARYVATFDPPTVLALLDVVGEAHNVLEAHDEADDEMDWTGPMVDRLLRAALDRLREIGDDRG